MTTGAGKVEAKVDHSSVYSTGAATVQAQSSEKISADVIAVSASIAAGAAGVAVAGAGTWVDNQTNVTTNAEIIGDGTTTTIKAGSVSVEADDNSLIDAQAIAGALSAAFGAVSVAVSVGVSIAANTISDPVTASIQSVPTLITGSGAVQVTANENATINGKVAAAAIAISGGAGMAVSIAGGGAFADNTIHANTSATISNSNLGATGTVGSVTVQATDTSHITADVVAAAASVAVSGGFSAGVALGISVAQNLIGDGSSTGTDSDDSDNHSQNNSPSVVTTGAGNVTASLTSTNVKSNGLVTVSAQAHEVIVAKTEAVSAALSGGAVGIAAAGAGVYNDNDDEVAVSATISGGTIGASNGVTVSASDISQISATAAAAAVAIAFGATGAGIAVGIALAWNTVGDTVNAAVSGATITGGALDIEAYKQASITATSASASFAAGFGAIGVAVSAAGAFAQNVITSNTLATVTSSILGTATSTIAGVTVQSRDLSTIDADIEAVAVSVAAGVAGLGVALGGSVAVNTIGGAGGAIQAYIQNTAINATGALIVNTQSTQQVTATVKAGAAALAAGFGAGAGAAAGVVATNTITQSIEAYISGDGGGVLAGSVSVNANDNSTIDSEGGAVAIAAAIGGFAGAISVAVAVVGNTINNTVQSFITGAATALNAGANYGTGASSAGGATETQSVTNGVTTVLISAGYDTPSYTVANGIVNLGRNQVVLDTTTGKRWQYLGAPRTNVDLGNIAGLNFTGTFTDANNVNQQDPLWALVGAINGVPPTTQDYSVATGLVTLNPNQVVLNTNGVSYRYVGLTQTGVDLAASVFTNTNLWKVVSGVVGATYKYVGGSGTIDLNNQDYVNSSSWQQVGFPETGQPSIQGSAVLVAGDTVTLVPQYTTASGTQNLGAGAVAQAQDGSIYTYIGSPGSVNLATTDFTSSAWRKQGSAGDVFEYLGGNTSKNLATEDYTVAALWRRVGFINVQASESATITADGQAAAAAVSGGGIAFSIAGAGIGVTNVILGSTQSYIHDSNIAATSDVSVGTTASATINATVEAASAALAFGGGAAAGALGVAVAQNFIGYLPPDGTHPLARKQPDVVSANISNDNSGSASDKISAGGVVSATANDATTIHATVAAESAAVVVALVGGAVAGAGGTAFNKVAVNDSATIGNSSFATTIEAGAVNVSATDSSTIGTFVGSAALAVDDSVAGDAAAAAFSLAENDITNNITASITNATVTSTGDTSVNASETTTIFGYAVAAAFSAGTSFSMSAGGVTANDNIQTATQAFINASTVNSTGGNVNVVANDASSADAETAAAAVAASVISFAMSGSDATVTVSNAVSALIEGVSTVDAAGAVNVTATAAPEVSGFAAGVTAGTLAVGELAAIVNANPTVTATVGGTVNAGSMNVTGVVNLPSSSAFARLSALAAAIMPFGISANLPAAGITASATAVGSAGGLIGIVATDSEATTTPVVTSGILGSAVITVAGALIITGLSNNAQSSDSENVAVGLVAVGAANATATTAKGNGNSTTASVGNNAKISAGTMQVNAVQNDNNFADTHAGSGGVVAGAAALPTTNDTAATQAIIGSSASGTGIVLTGGRNPDGSVGQAFVISAAHTATVNTKVVANADRLPVRRRRGGGQQHQLERQRDHQRQHHRAFDRRNGAERLRQAEYRRQHRWLHRRLCQRRRRHRYYDD